MEPDCIEEIVSCGKTSEWRAEAQLETGFSEKSIQVCKVFENDSVTLCPEMETLYV